MPSKHRPPRLLIFACLAVLAPALLFAEPNRFDKDSRGVITDGKTGLHWYASPTGGFSHVSAKAWASDLSVGGGGWRLPTRSELMGLKTAKRDGCYYDAAFRSPQFASAGWCGFVWSSEVLDSAKAWGVVFADGKEDTHVRDARAKEYRAFAVRRK